MKNYKDYEARDYARVIATDKDCTGYVGRIEKVDSIGAWFEEVAPCEYKYHVFNQLEPVEDKQEKSADEKVKDYLERAWNILDDFYAHPEIKPKEQIETAKMIQREELNETTKS